MCGNENWSLNRSDMRKTEAAEMRFLRPMAGYTLWDKKRSSDIRDQLGIFNIIDTLTQYKINWRKHIQRMDDARQELIYYFAYFPTVIPSNSSVFLSCRPFVVNTTFTTGLVGVEVHTTVGWDGKIGK